MKSNNESNVLMEKKATKNSVIVKNIVSRFTRGNVNLQMDNYLTKKDQDARKKALSDRKKEVEIWLLKKKEWHGLEK